MSAAVSLTGPLERVAGDFQRGTGTAVELNLAGSSTLAAQILAGAPVDLFISADERQMDRVASEALIDGNTEVVLLSNRLAVVVPAGVPAPPGDAGPGPGCDVRLHAEKAPRVCGAARTARLPPIRRARSVLPG